MKVEQGQSFLDKVIEQTGSLDNAFEMALLNNLSLTDGLQIGSELSTAGTVKRGIVSLFGKNNKPATALAISRRSVFIDDLEEQELSSGIGFMIIETNFEVA